MTNPYGIAVDAANVYWSDDSSIYKVPLGGGAATSLASGRCISVDATSLYYVTYTPPGGSLMKTPLAGGAPTLLARVDATCSATAVDSTSVYWTVAPGNVMKLTPK